MADPIIWKDENGSNKELRAGFYIRQPSSSSHAERENAARHACEAEGRRKVEEWNSGPFPMKMDFYSVNLIGMEGVTTRTETNPWTGVRHHECKGTGVAHLLFTIRGGGTLRMMVGGKSKEGGEVEEEAWSATESWKVTDKG